ncbi:MAG: amidohydrolase family protein [Sphingomonas sp.]|uniref:amidohydrolase family protein n=1 Tax=Sphingomonas sp. TaxID=28214 RepID=UPI003F7D7B63
MRAGIKTVLALAASLAVAASGDAAGPAVGGYAGPITDAHAHLRLGADDGLLDNQPIGTVALREIDASAGVTRSALIVIARRGDMAATRRQNDAVIAAAKASGGHFYPVASVHPLDGAPALAELERLAKLGVREIKFHPNTQNFDVADPAVDTVVEKAGELGLVCLFDSYKPWDANEMGKFLLLSVKHPKSRLVLAHIGFSQFREAIAFAQIKKLNMGGNVWFDTSATVSAFAESPMAPELLWTMRQIGMDHFLFGSDWPVDTPAVAAAALRRLGLTPAEQRAVFHDNVQKLLGLPPEAG